MLTHKKILLGITGSIAAYKSAFLVRLLIKSGADVKVIMTSAAKDFIAPLTISTLSKNAVYSDFYDASTGEWANHVELALWADIFLIAPATANEIAKMANGLCDNLLTATYLSAKCPVVIAPAMDLDMYIHPATKNNFHKLLSFGNHIIDAESGELASGLSGQGRMAEPEHIIHYLVSFLSRKNRYAGKKVLVTAGPTQEAIDPVRYISNHSSGKMGYALAETLADEGAEVILISGPSQLIVSNKNIKVVKVKSALEMLEECRKVFFTLDIAIFSAAVADYRVKEMATQKIKKKDDSFVIEMVKNPDIAFEFGRSKSEKQISVGFALETNNELENASLKLTAKNFDFVVLNSTQSANATFGHDTNKITILKKSGEKLDFDLKTKKEVAKDILDVLIDILN
ncbi:MAG: bifunctional phosphopantothenoylcysteine decarboxylase/phosphopantothenate--cysteine ligase CoaBC [Cytophagales bacterium]